MAAGRSNDPKETRDIVRGWRADGLTVGFVPTMGALHQGHLSLIRDCVQECDRTVVSIYVNPTQFGPDEDLEQYPRRVDADCAVAEEAGVDLVFCPTDEVMYPKGHVTHVDQEGATEMFEGAFRPAHFRGVLTVVCKLFNIVPADRAYFGMKDFQQTVIVRRMVRDLNFPVDIRIMPTVREPDGLAISSRNEYLSEEERQQALCLYNALREAARLYANGETDANALRYAMEDILAGTPLASPDYVDIVDRETMEPLDVVDERAVAVLAVQIGQTRLIDDMPFAEPL